MGAPREIEGRWTSQVVLKRDHFSTVERGRFAMPDGDVEAVLRRIDEVPWWTYPVARHLFIRERLALARANGLGVAPSLLFAGRQALVRGWIDGVALQVAKPYGDSAYFASAKAALRKLHRAGICHNDLSKQQNWLRGRDGRAYLTDFQLASCFARRGRLFRLLAYEDLRRLLKHKHRYLRGKFTAAEWQVRRRKSVFASLWLVTVKPLYNWTMHGLFGYVDREGGGAQLAYDGPRLVECLKKHPGVRDVVIVPFYDRGARHNLYAFVEGTADLSDSTLRQFITHSLPEVAPPLHIHISASLPRDPGGNVRTEILQLVGANQLDQVDTLITNDEQRVIVARIIAERHNLHDRF